MSQLRSRLATAIGAVLCFILLYTALLGELLPLPQRAIPLALAGALAVLLLPASRSRPDASWASALGAALVAPAEIDTDVYGPSRVNESPIRTMGAAMIFTTHDEIDADLVDRFLSLMGSEIDPYRGSGILEKRIQFGTALRGMTLPLHPGAERFYREKGLLR